MAERPSWGVQQAARECGVSPATIRRRLKDGSLPNAVQGARGAWSIPVTDLIAAGLNPGQPSPPDHEQGVVIDPTHAKHDHGHGYGQSASSQEAALQNLDHKLLSEQREVDHLRTQVSTLQNNLEDLRTAMRMLEAAPAGRPETPQEPTPSDEPEPDPEPASRTSFLGRLFGRK